jgi:hypothetical protein
MAAGIFALAGSCVNNRAYNIAGRADDKRQMMRCLFEAAVNLIGQADKLRLEAVALDAELHREVAAQLEIEEQLKEREQ